MSYRVISIPTERQETIYDCDLCGQELGPAPIDQHGGYMLSTSIQAKNDKRPLWHGEVCRSCIDDIRVRSRFDEQLREALS